MINNYGENENRLALFYYENINRNTGYKHNEIVRYTQKI